MKMYEKYIENVCEIIKSDSLFKSEIKNTHVIENANKKSKTASSYEDCHNIIDEILLGLKQLGDLHSKFKKYNPELSTQYEDEDINVPPEIKVMKNCGYIKLTSFDGNDEEEILKFSQNIHNEMRKISRQKLRGYIVDLQDNPGGNMDPMILGLGFLIEKNPCAYFSFPNNTKHSWGYKDGKYYYNDEIIFTLNNPFKQKNRIPVAILISKRTASSAEMLTVSLMNGNVRLFGNTTKNRTTGNTVYKLEDKSKLILSTCKLQNLNEEDFLQGIKPDVIVSENDVVESAIQWLASF